MISGWLSVKRTINPFLLRLGLTERPRDVSLERLISAAVGQRLAWEVSILSSFGDEADVFIYSLSEGPWRNAETSASLLLLLLLGFLSLPKSLPIIRALFKCLWPSDFDSGESSILI